MLGANHDGSASGVFTDRVGVLTTDFFRTLTMAFPDAHIEPAHVVTDEDHVCLAYTLTGTHQGEFQGVPATGKRIEVRGMQIGRFENGQIVERWGASDELGIMQRGYAPDGTAAGSSSITYWQVEDVEASLTDLVERGGRVHMPVIARGDFMTASAVDPFGNVIGLMHSPHWAARH